MSISATQKRSGPGRPPKPGGQDKTYTVRLPPAVMAKITARAIADGETRSELIREAVERELKRRTRTPRQAS